jgi:replication factor C small subunit
MSDLDKLFWSEKYRPKTIDECILPELIKAQARGMVADKNITSLLFKGGAGCGKTTLAQAMATEMGADFMRINASLERGIDTVKTTISQFASTVSFTDSKKLTLLDEADGLTPDAQKSLRGIFEEFGNNHTFILTCNFSSKIIEPIRSRCKIIDFKFSAKDKTELATQFVKRTFTILEAEGVDYDKRAVAELVMKKFPDFRSILNELQGYAAGGRIDAGILMSLSDEAFNKLCVSLKAKKFNDVRKWVGENTDINPSEFFRIFYDKAAEKLEQKSIPDLVLILGEYSYRSAFVADQEINTMAFLTALLYSDSIVWK